MNRVQELIDENMDQMPTGLAKTLLEACKAEADAKPKLYRITLTRVTSVPYMCEIDDEPEASVKLRDLTETFIVEVIDDAAYKKLNGYPWETDLIAEGMLHESWLSYSMPQIRNLGTSMLIVHSIVPYVAKRGREE